MRATAEADLDSRLTNASTSGAGVCELPSDDKFRAPVFVRRRVMDRLCANGGVAGRASSPFRAARPKHFKAQLYARASAGGDHLADGGCSGWREEPCYRTLHLIVKRQQEVYSSRLSEGRRKSLRAPSKRRARL